MSEHNVKFQLAEYLQAMESRLRDDIRDVKADNIMRHNSHEKATKAHVDELQEGQSKLSDKVEAHVDELKEGQSKLSDKVEAHVDELKEDQSKVSEKVDSNAEKLSEIKGQLDFLKPVVIGAVVAFVLWVASLIVSNTCQNVTWC